MVILWYLKNNFTLNMGFWENYFFNIVINKYVFVT